ncbi:N-carbamoylputrescine amidase [Leeia sp.]|uniref:N-carbamoylputrescine amidase n=1 Tax=Leeia sp. TaxID=2884678 RepID=UPI0035AEBA73
MDCTVAAIQMAAASWQSIDNIATAERLVRQAAAQGAQVVLLPELFELPYFCTDQDAAHLRLAQPMAGHPTLQRFSRLAAELQLVMPISFFERAGQVYYNSIAMLDADGQVLGVYRKTHIPDGPGYNEKFYFTPGDTGFKVWHTRYGRIGVGICWDQWFPEAARIMALQGAELLLYPTAIGSEPQDPALDSSAHWQRVMQGHAAANVIPVIAANRIGVEQGQRFSQRYYGSSFLTDETGALLVSAGQEDERVLLQTYDLRAIERRRHAWGLFRDRRPQCYGGILSSDGMREIEHAR